MQCTKLRKSSFTSIKKLLHVKRDYNINIKITPMCDVNEKFLEGPYLKQHSSSVNEGLFWLDQFSVKANDSQTTYQISNGYPDVCHIIHIINLVLISLLRIMNYIHSKLEKI
jgi:hypothetical protein